MLKKFLKLFLCIGTLFSIKINADDVACLSVDLVDITHRLNDQEIKFVETQEKVVYLNSELIQALDGIEINVDCALKDLKELVRLGYSVAPYNETLEAVNHAICLCTQQNKNYQSLNALGNYKTLLESDQATLVVEKAVDRKSCRTKKFNKICVGSIVASGCELLINSNVRVCGVLNPSGGIGVKGTCNESTTPIVFNAPIRTCGSIVFNDVPTSNALFTVGNLLEFKVSTLRTAIDFSSPALTLNIANTAGVPNLGGAITIAGTLPIANIVSGEGVSLVGAGTVSPVTATNVNFLDSLTFGPGATGNITFSFPVTFPVGLNHDRPSVELSYSIDNPSLLVANNGPTSILSLTNIAVSTTNVSPSGMTLTITAVPLGAGTFPDIAALQTTLAQLLNGLFSTLTLNIWVASHDI